MGEVTVQLVALIFLINPLVCLQSVLSVMIALFKKTIVCFVSRKSIQPKLPNIKPSAKTVLSSLTQQPILLLLAVLAFKLTQCTTCTTSASADTIRSNNNSKKK